jgi:hypothetical protein
MRVAEIAEKLLVFQPGDGSQALRMIHSLVHITGRSVMTDNLSLVEDHYREEDEI